MPDAHGYSICAEIVLRDNATVRKILFNSTPT